MTIKTIIKKIKRGAVGVLLFLSSFSLQSCTVDGIVDELLAILQQIMSQTGWLVNEEEMENIPEDITPFDNDDSQPLQSRVLLEDKFPPIGDQGSYGTCVVWSVGYNLKTALNAIEKGWTQSDLALKNNQTSPKDLWFSIPGSGKGTQCNGTNFEPAMDALIEKGAASLSVSPYTNLGNCTGTGSGDSQNKLANYRKIAYKDLNTGKEEGLAVENFKGYLNAGRPIAIGAQLGDRFMDWKSSAVITSDTYNKKGMQHAYHAMVLVGYDDDKDAFRVRNSWGDSWGDNGSIWVGYDFFCRSFCFAAFVAQNTTDAISTGNLRDDYDLLAYYAEDYQDPEGSSPTDRLFTYEVYNSGNKTITPQQRWSVIYMLYNAVDANEKEIIYVDYYTDKYYTEGGEKEGPYTEGEAENALYGGWWNYAFVEPGKMAGEEDYEDGFVINYTMPNVTGKYYLVVMADSYNAISEVNEDNNFYFIAGENGKPLEFKNGIATNMPSPRYARSMGKQPRPEAYSNTENQTPVKPGNLNAYTPQELQAMLLHEKKTGKLQSKINEFNARNAGGETVKRTKKAIAD